MKARLQKFNLLKRDAKREQQGVPEIISTLRQAGKTSARQEEVPGVPEEYSDAIAAIFAKKFEVLFCGRASVPHKKAPPALIDECIDRFRHASGGGLAGASASAVAQLKRAFFAQ
ncbi:hypothetical protein COCON_G00105540, partial [Conger conger]